MVSKLKKAIKKHGIVKIMLGLNVSMPTIYRWIRLKKVPDHRRRQIENFLKEN